MPEVAKLVANKCISVLYAKVDGKPTAAMPFFWEGGK